MAPSVHPFFSPSSPSGPSSPSFPFSFLLACWLSGACERSEAERCRCDFLFFPSSVTGYWILGTYHGRLSKQLGFPFYWLLRFSSIRGQLSDPMLGAFCVTKLLFPCSCLRLLFESRLSTSSESVSGALRLRKRGFRIKDVATNNFWHKSVRY